MLPSRIRLERTCFACPEQYDVFVDGEKLGYLRLRHGEFRAEYRGEDVLWGEPKGDGIFDEDERDEWLERASRAILEAHEIHCRDIG